MTILKGYFFAFYAGKSKIMRFMLVKPTILRAEANKNDDEIGPKPLDRYFFTLAVKKYLLKIHRSILEP